jgi:hypothetical protein
MRAAVSIWSCDSTVQGPAIVAGDRDHVVHAREALQLEVGDVLAVADGADDRVYLPARDVRGGTGRLDLADHRVHLLGLGPLFHDDHHLDLLSKLVVEILVLGLRRLGLGRWGWAAIGPAGRRPTGSSARSRGPSAGGRGRTPS